VWVYHSVIVWNFDADSITVLYKTVQEYNNVTFLHCDNVREWKCDVTVVALHGIVWEYDSVCNNVTMSQCYTVTMWW